MSGHNGLFASFAANRLALLMRPNMALWEIFEEE